MAVKTVFNYGLSTSKVETIDSKKEFDVLRSLPPHRNLVRIVFECIAKPPLWMVELLPDPKLVCLDAGHDGEGMPAGALTPRKAQMIGVEIL